MKAILYNIWHSFFGHPIKDCYNIEQEPLTAWCTKCKIRIHLSDWY